MRHRILVPLLNDPTVLCESEALAAGDGRFRITGVAPGQRLLFDGGEIVECEIRTLPSGATSLVAIRSVPIDPEFQKRQIVFAICGSVVGAALGTAVALWIAMSAASATIGALLGGITFAFCSMRWGDDAWDTLSRVLRGL